MAPTRFQRGFTLVEAMIVVAMIAILAALAVAYTGEGRATVKGFAAQMAGECDAARLTAISTHKWERLSFDQSVHKVIREQATVTGMGTPDTDEWEETGRLDLPAIVHIESITTTADITAGNSVTPGFFEDDYLLFAPDGSSVARTVYLDGYDGHAPQRLVVYRATGTAYVKEGW